MAVIFVFVRDIKKMPVVSGGRLVGALSRRNVIDYLMGELEKSPAAGRGLPASLAARPKPAGPGIQTRVGQQEPPAGPRRGWRAAWF